MATITLLYIIYALQKTFNISNKIRIIEKVIVNLIILFSNLDTKFKVKRRKI